MKACRRFCNLTRTLAFARQTKIANGLNAFQTFGHRTQFRRRRITEPQAIPLLPIDKLFSSKPSTKVASGPRLLLQERITRLFCKKIIPTINRLVPNSHHRHRTKWMRHALDKNIRSVHQVPVDVSRRNPRTVVIKQPFCVGRIARSRADPRRGGCSSPSCSACRSCGASRSKASIRRPHRKSSD